MEIDNCRNARDLAALSLRFVDLVKQIDELVDYQKPGRADEIADRRAKRRRARGIGQ